MRIAQVGSKQTLARSMSLISVSIYIGFLLAQGAVWLVQDMLAACLRTECKHKPISTAHLNQKCDKTCHDEVTHVPSI